MMKFIIGLAGDQGQMKRVAQNVMHLQSISHHRLTKEPSTEPRTKDAVMQKLLAQFQGSSGLSGCHNSCSARTTWRPGGPCSEGFDDVLCCLSSMAVKVPGRFQSS